MMRGLLGTMLLWLAAPVCGQELVWEVHPVSGVRYGGCYPEFGDYDGDGFTDLLVGGTDYRSSYPLAIVRVLSGADGSVLEELHHPQNAIAFTGDVGDFDGDGVPDITIGMGSYIDVWSLIRGVSLAHLPIPPGSAGAYPGALCGLDCDGDHLRDVVYSLPNATILACDHSGTLLYTIPSLSLGFIPVDLATVGDLDGDGCDDFVVGAAELWTGLGYGAVILVSGRTGTPLRIHWGPQPFDGLNSDVRAAGDVDGDGVMDYAAGNKGGFRGVILVWSGATGAVLQQWAVPVGELSGQVLAGMDVDLDGRPDVMSIVSAYQNPSGLRGRVRMLSTHDGQDLVHLESQQYTTVWGQTYADLGVQPGNPYPVFALMDDPVVPPYNNWQRIRAWRCSPAGTRLVGAGCASTGAAPTIGIRRVDAAPSEHSRLVLGSAPPNAFAVCVAAPTSLTFAPLALDVLGMAGCDLLVPPAILELRLTGGSGMERGYAAFDIQAAMVPTGGVEYAAQWVVLDPATLAYATTARCEFRVQ